MDEEEVILKAQEHAFRLVGEFNGRTGSRNEHKAGRRSGTGATCLSVFAR